MKGTQAAPWCSKCINALQDEACRAGKGSDSEARAVYSEWSLATLCPGNAPWQCALLLQAEPRCLPFAEVPLRV